MADNNDNGSFFKNAFIASPAIAGAAVTGYRVQQNWSTFTKPLTSVADAPAQLAAESIRGFAAQYSTPQAGPIRQWQVDQLVQLSKTTKLSIGQARNAILEAADIVDAGGGLRKRLNEQISNATSGAQVLENFAEALRTTESVYARRTASIFMQDLGVLEQRIESGLPIDFAGAAKVSTEDIRNISGAEIADFDVRLAADLEKMQDVWGADLELYMKNRGDIPGQELTVKFPAVNGRPEFELRVPMELAEQPGVVVRGASQQSRYIAGRFAMVSQGALVETPFKYEEWLMRRAREELIPQIMEDNKSRWEIKRLVSEFEQSIAEALEWVPSLPRGEHAALDEYIDTRSQILRLRDMKGETLDAFTQAKILESGGLKTSEGMMELWPGFSATQAGESVVATADIREGAFLVPEAAPFERKPASYLRKEFAPTAAALEAMEKSPVTRFFNRFGVTRGVPAPMVRTAFISSAYEHKIARFGMTGEGQHLISTGLREELGTRQWVQFDIAKERMVDLAEMLDDTSQSRWDLNRIAEEGTYLGKDPTGRPITLSERMKLISATAFENDMAKGNFIRVMAEREITDPEAAKFFGFKGMGRFVSPAQIEKALAGLEIGFDQASFLGMSEARGDLVPGGIDALITMDELRKNRALHYNQMFTSLWDTTLQNMKTGNVGVRASAFAMDPLETIREMRGRALQNGVFKHDVMLSEIGSLAREANLTPEQLGSVFGAVPEVAGDLSSLSGMALTATEEAQIRRGVAYGATQLFFGGTGGSGSGGVATIEPRMFELLDAPHWGSMGQEVKHDIAQRMMAANPERLLEQKELFKSLQSITKPTESASARVLMPAEMLGPKGQISLPLEPTTMRVPGVGDIYIPGRERLSQLAGYETAAGQSIESPLAYAYKDMIDVANQFQSKQVTQEVVKEKLATLQEEVARAWTGTVTRKGGLLRGRIPGSAALTAVTPIASEKLAPGAIGITEKYANRMFEDMAKLGPDVYDPEALKGMRERFMAGEAVPGIVARHPFIGPYSTQATMVQRIAGKGDIVVVPEQRTRAVMMRGEANAEKLAAMQEAAAAQLAGNKALAERRASQIGAEVLGSPLRLSPLVGMAGDVDGDVLSVMFAGPQLEKSLTSHIADKSALEAYEEYAIRSQVMKAKVKGGDVTLRRLMAGASMKLGVTEGGMLGRLSVNMQQYRAALLAGAGGLSAQERTHGLALLEWLEQTPISSKHIQPGREENLLYLMNDIEEALANKDAKLLTKSADSVLEYAKESAKGSLREGFTIAMEDLENPGQIRTRSIQGLSVDRTSGNIMTALKAYEATDAGSSTMGRIRSIMMNRGTQKRLTGKELTTLMSAEATAKSPLAQFLFTSGKGGRGANAIMGINTFLNKLGAAGKSMIPYAKPLALGTGIAAGLAAVLSEPPRVLDPGATVAPQADLSPSGNTENMNTNIHPESNISGEPTAPTRIPQSPARLAPPASTGYRVKVRGMTGSSLDYGSLTSQVRQVVGGRARVNSTVRDRRSTLNPQKIAKILAGER